MHSTNWRELAQAELDRKTKPLGSLGQLENLAVQLAGIQQTLSPDVAKKRLVVFAANHGITEEGVSAYPSDVTAQMLANFEAGGAAINVLARYGGIDLQVCDAGVAQGTANFLKEKAMPSERCEAALEQGKAEARRALEEGCQLFGIGEMGIGNTTSATALLCALGGFAPSEITGKGTGIDDMGLEKKQRVIAAALQKYRLDCHTPQQWLEAVGGLEIAAMIGAVLEATKSRLPLVVDGFIASAAAFAAIKIEPTCQAGCFFSHLSGEKGHRRILDALGVLPVLQLGMRLGEGTGAALAMPVIEAAAKILCEMATFESASVSEKVI